MTVSSMFMQWALVFLAVMARSMSTMSVEAAGGVATPASTLPQHRIRGVNLGGWLVLERWIKPSLFQDGFKDNGYIFSEYNPKNVPADEWNFCKLQGKSICSNRLKKHWDTWVTRADLQKLANAGINHLRVPVGYWIMGDIQSNEPYVIGGEDEDGSTKPGQDGTSLYYLTRVCGWAKENGQQVWIDLHGAPGSQNGFDNSGHYGNYTWDKKPENVKRSVKVLEQLAKYFATEGYADVLTGIGLLNEPETMIDTDTLTDFYADAFRATRQHLPDCNIFLADRFIPSDWNDLWATGGPDGYQNWGDDDDDSSDLKKNSITDTKKKPDVRRKLSSSAASDGVNNAKGVNSISNEAFKHLPRQEDYPIFQDSVRQLRSGEQQQQQQQQQQQEGNDAHASLERKLMEVDLGSHDHPGSFANSKGSVLLDTHIYHVFTDIFRLYPAVRHIGHVCLSDSVLLNNCCWQHKKPTKLKRMVGEWTAAFDQAPSEGLEAREPKMKPMSRARKEFLMSFAKAQMITFEMEGHLDSEPIYQTIQGWFFWNFKMELEVYREWDYLKGLERGWIPKLPTDGTSTALAADLFGSCEDQRQVILHDKRMKHIVDPYPEKYNFPNITEDPELSPTDDDLRTEWFGKDPVEPEHHVFFGLVVAIAAVGFVVLVAKRRRSKKGYGESSPLLGGPVPHMRQEISIKELGGMVEQN